MVFLAFAENSIQLVPDGTIFFHIALILLMVWVLNRTLFKPINRVLEERASQTGGRSGKAGEILREADEKLVRYEQSLREARNEGYRVIEQTRAQALAARQQQIEAVRSEVDTSIQQETAALNAQVEQARQRLASDARVLADRITAQVLRQRVAA